MQLTFKELHNALPQTGSVKTILIRPEKYRHPVAVDSVHASPDQGLKGDHFQSHSKKRQVTLIQYEHLPVIASLLGKTAISPAQLRRNIVVAGINLLALKNKVFAIGDVQLTMTGLCHPCSRMEKTLGSGGYNAMRGHGGITAQILKAGNISVNDCVQAVIP
ncbi:MAG: MOSC domain-containing protein [Gammaproteobacteria bacterium]|jgi:MOSC domain-containing protein YiiM